MHRLYLIGLLLLCLPLVAWACLRATDTPDTDVHPESAEMLVKITASATPVPDAAPFAVVELFTSEGCSSCPPADRVLAAMVADARADGRRVFPLSFHVDYWNYIGWKDPYSDASYSDRQRTYTRALSERTYTPQMIVNGQEVFVGSSKIKAQLAVERSLEAPATASVKITATPSPENNTVLVQYEVTNAPKGAVLNLAVVQRGLSQEVSRGENRNKTLPHENVVRAFETVEAGKDSIVIEIPASVKLADASVFAYVQHPKTMAVLGATGEDLNQPDS